MWAEGPQVSGGWRGTVRQEAGKSGGKEGGREELMSGPRGTLGFSLPWRRAEAPICPQHPPNPHLCRGASAKTVRMRQRTRWGGVAARTGPGTPPAQPPHPALVHSVWLRGQPLAVPSRLPALHVATASRGGSTATEPPQASPAPSPRPPRSRPGISGTAGQQVPSPSQVSTGPRGSSTYNPACSRLFKTDAPRHAGCRKRCGTGCHILRSSCGRGRENTPSPNAHFMGRQAGAAGAWH